MYMTLLRKPTPWQRLLAERVVHPLTLTCKGSVPAVNFRFNPSAQRIIAYIRNVTNTLIMRLTQALKIEENLRH